MSAWEKGAFAALAATGVITLLTLSAWLIGGMFGLWIVQ